MPSNKLKAKLRICSHCMWLFKAETIQDVGCPLCGFGSYGARASIGPRVYNRWQEQGPWFQNRMARIAGRLHTFIAKNTAPSTPKKIDFQFVVPESKMVM